MGSSQSVNELLEELEFLFKGYSNELRATTHPHRLASVSSAVKDYVYRPEDSLVRETLLEHVGSLPIVATTFYPHLQDDSVDLGQALVMLAVHDIGELITGDEITFTKKSQKEKKEQAEALKLLHTFYHDAYRDIEAPVSQTAKFARAIDKITPDILDYLTPAEITVERYKHFVGTEPHEIVDLIVKHKRPHMLWNPFMTEFHTLLMDHLAAKLQKV